MLSPFWFWPADRRTLYAFSLGAIATIVVSASVLTGVMALGRDLRVAYLWAGPSIFREEDSRQMEAVRDALVEGEVIAVYANADDAWYARVWQRGLYPRNRVVVLLSASPEGLRGLRERFGVRRAVRIGPPSFAPPLRGERDLGPLAGRPARVSFGELP